MTPKQHIRHANRYPFDETNDWWHASSGKPSTPTDWAHSAARGIISDLQGRQGIKHELETEKIDEGTRKEIVAEIAAIIRASASLR